MRRKGQWLQWPSGLALPLICAGIIFFISSWYIIPVIRSAADQPASSRYNDLGSFLSGTAGVCFSLATLFYLIQTLKEQRINFERQQVENRIFELIKMHRSSIESADPRSASAEPPFESIKKCYDHILEIVMDQYIPKKYLQKELRFLQMREYKMLLKNSINISYLIAFYGIGFNKSLIYRQLNKSYPTIISSEEFDKLISSLANEQKNFQISTGLDISKGLSKFLSPHFRQLFQTVDYVNQQSILNYDQKYQFVVLLRSQLSIEEQWMLFYNSLSYLGDKWEYSQSDPNKMLITKYNLLKNLPNRFLDDAGFSVEEIDPSIFYALIFYETDIQENPQREKMRKIYN